MLKVQGEEFDTIFDEGVSLFPACRRRYGNLQTQQVFTFSSILGYCKNTLMQTIAPSGEEEPLVNIKAYPAKFS